MDIMIKINNTQNYKDKLVCEGVLKMVDSKPIVISESEKIEVGDWCLYKDKHIGKLTGIEEFEGENIDSVDLVKILALSEHFSPETLKDIVYGKLKDGDKVLVECVKEEPIPMDYHGVDLRGDYKYYCPKCGWGGSYMGTEQVHCYKNSCRETAVKLNPHIIIYPVEEKMYMREEVLTILHHFNSKCRAVEGYMLDKWFEQNVK